MNRITEVTKRDILDLFRNGIEMYDFWEPKRVMYNYYGRLEELVFLQRLYDLKSIPSLEHRFTNAEEEIRQHTVINDDYPCCWVFEDERFKLKNGNDEDYLRFICEIFHPEVRDENGYWKEFLDEINKLLRNDRYELYPAKKMSNRDFYDWRIYYPEESKIFIPYSQRNRKMIDEKRIKLSIKKSARHQIYQILNKYDSIFRETTETGFNFEITTSEKVFKDIRRFYTPKCYNVQNKYIETNSLEEFILGCPPYYVLDVIEFFEKYSQGTEFTIEINEILKLNELPFRLVNGKIVDSFDKQVLNISVIPVSEAGLSELLRDAEKYYDKGNLRIAVEKLWDAFERLKTYYSPTLNKKKSVEKIIYNMSENKVEFRELFEKEFRELTDIGNKFRIRHHETTITEINDDRHYEYFFKRCLSLVSVALKYLD